MKSSKKNKKKKTPWCQSWADYVWKQVSKDDVKKHSVGFRYIKSVEETKDGFAIVTTDTLKNIPMGIHNLKNRFDLESAKAGNYFYAKEGGFLSEPYRLNFVYQPDTTTDHFASISIRKHGIWYPYDVTKNQLLTQFVMGPSKKELMRDDMIKLVNDHRYEPINIECEGRIVTLKFKQNF